MSKIPLEPPKRYRWYEKYPDIYDIIYKGTKYETSVNFIDNLIKEQKLYGPIIDFCCGTGTHAKLLTERGYSVKGIDISNTMLEVAKAKAPAAEFFQGDMRTFRIPTKIIICMYGSIHYNLTDRDITKTLKNFYKNLGEGGVVIIEGRDIKGITGREIVISRKIDGQAVTFKSRWFDINGMSAKYKIYNLRTTLSLPPAFEDYIEETHEYNFLDPVWIRTKMETLGFEVQLYKGFSRERLAPETITPHPVIVGFKKKQ